MSVGATVRISDSQFVSNDASDFRDGSAIRVKGGILNIERTIFR